MCTIWTMALFQYDGNSRFISPRIHILTVNRITDGWNYPDLSAPYWRLYWICRGDLWGLWGEKEIRLAPGKRYLIPPDTTFAARSREEIDQIYIHFIVEDLEGPGESRTAPGIYTLPDRLGQEEQFLELASGAAGRAFMDYRRSQLSASLCSLALADLPAPALAEPITDSRLLRAVDFIRANLTGSLYARDIAMAAGMGRKSLERLFVKSFGETPLQYRQRLRVGQACLSLHFTQKPLEVIAEELGFSDRFHLTRVFTRIRKISPGRYRRLTEELS